MNFNNSFMRDALEEAKKAYLEEEVPVGCVIVKDNRVIASARNSCIKNNDSTMHAEMNAIKQAFAAMQSCHLEGCDLYVTLEPCPMCAQAISLARIDRLYFGAYDPKSGGVEFGPRVLSSTSAHHKPEIYGGILEQESNKLLKDFFSKLRIEK